MGDETRRLYPAGGGRALEGDAPARRRVRERESAGMEGQPAEGIPLTAVRAVTQDGVAQVCELHADLVAAAGAEREGEHGRVAPPCEHAVVRDRLLAGPAGAHAKPAVLEETALERAGGCLDATLDDRHVVALGRARLELRLTV